MMHRGIENGMGKPCVLPAFLLQDRTKCENWILCITNLPDSLDVAVSDSHYLGRTGKKLINILMGEDTLYSM